MTVTALAHWTGTRGSWLLSTARSRHLDRP
jgi:hypothetical protein